MVTIRQVAKAAGVSVATASRALNGLASVTPATRKKIEAEAARLRYVPHNGARNLTRRKTDTIGVILPDLFGEFFSEIIRGIDQVIHDAGKSLLLGNMHGSTQETMQAIRSMRGRVDGMLVMPPNANAADVDSAAHVSMPIVLLNASADRGRLPFVAVDNYAGARLVTQHLVDRGARRIVHLAGPASNRDAAERERGFRQVLKEQLGELSPTVVAGSFKEEAGANAARMILDGSLSCDALFAANDVMAVELMAVLRDGGVAVGKDILVAGFDDIPLARYVYPQLTTVHSDITRLGAAGAEMILRMLDEEDGFRVEPLRVTPTLAIRASTAGTD